MKNLKSHFWYNKRQRNGIFFLLLLIIIFQLTYFFVDFSSDKITGVKSDEIESFQKQLDSLELIELENRKPKIYPFNPSFITDYKGAQLGMSNNEIDRLLKHREDGKYINSVNQFQTVAKVSDSLLATIAPYFKFPDWVTKARVSKNKKQKTVVSKLNVSFEIQDLNKATSEELRKINGVGSALSERIIKYRKSLNGFMFDDQLNEVYGLKSEVIILILKRFSILSKPIIKKLNVNTATFKEVLHLPYIDYELTKRIFQYRDEVAEIQTIEELKNIEGFPLDKFSRIIVYLEAN